MALLVHAEGRFYLLAVVVRGVEAVLVDAHGKVLSIHGPEGFLTHLN